MQNIEIKPIVNTSIDNQLQTSVTVGKSFYNDNNRCMILAILKV